MEKILIFDENKKQELKDEFQAIHGTKDEFVVMAQEDNFKILVNGARGIIKVKEQGRDEYELNIFQTISSLDNFTEMMEKLDIMPIADPPRPSAWRTGGADKANLKVVKGSSRDSITAYHPLLDGKPASKSYTKPTSGSDYWYSGYTKGYYLNVGEARKCWGTYRNSLPAVSVTTLIVIATAYLSVGGTLNPAASTVAALILKHVGGISSSTALYAAGHLIAYLGHIAIVTNNYNRL